MREEQDRLARVAARLHQIEQKGTMPHYDVILKTVEPQLVATIRAVVSDYFAICRYHERLYAYLGGHELTGQAGRRSPCFAWPPDTSRTARGFG